MILAVGPVVLFLHGEVLGDGSGIEIQSFDDRALRISLSLKAWTCLNITLLIIPAPVKFFSTIQEFSSHGNSIYRAYGIFVYHDHRISVYHFPRNSAYHSHSLAKAHLLVIDD